MKKSPPPRPKKGKKSAPKAQKPVSITPKTKKPSTVPRKPDGSIDWRRYNEALAERGDVHLWIDQETLDRWREQINPKKRMRGGQRTYSDEAIMCVLTLRSVFHLALRQVEKFCCSLLQNVEAMLPVPNYSTLSRRCADVIVRLPRRIPDGPIDIVVDSTGLKIYGEGEWKVRQHGWSKRRRWLKLHLAIDVKTQEPVATVVSSDDVSDDEAFSYVLDEIEAQLASVGGDGAYDKSGVREKIEERGAEPRIPPRRGAIVQSARSAATSMADARRRALDKRDAAIRRIEELQREKTDGDLGEARKLWKQETAYHQRSKAETAMYRYKTIFGGAVRARKFENQTKEICINVAALAKMTRLGIPSVLTKTG